MIPSRVLQSGGLLIIAMLLVMSIAGACRWYTSIVFPQLQERVVAQQHTVVSDPKSVVFKNISVVREEEQRSNISLEKEPRTSLSMTYPECRGNLTINTFPQLHEWTQNSLPLLQSVVKGDGGVYNVIVLVRHLTDHESWALKRWLCHPNDGRTNPMEATLMNPDIKSTWELLILQCPAADFLTLSVVGNESAVAGDQHTYQEYDVRPFLECEELYEPPQTSSPVQAAVCTQIRGGGPAGMLEEWVEYHRLVGFQHFWVYVNDDPSMIANLPQRDYITYIPYNYCLCHHNENKMFSKVWWTAMPAFQTAVMGECIFRARKDGIRWLALHDVDEYFQVLDESSATSNVIDYIETLPSKDDVGGIIVNSIPFGRHPEIAPDVELMMDFVWRKNYTVNKPVTNRLKLIIHPDKVNQVGVHCINSGQQGLMLEWDTQMRVLHYKRAYRGVFQGRGDIVRDDSSLANSTLRDQVYEKVRGTSTKSQV